MTSRRKTPAQLGTNAEITSLSSSLGMSVEDVQAMMSSQGSGLRNSASSNRRSSPSDTNPTPASAPIWSDFLQDVNNSSDAAATDKKAEEDTEDANKAATASKPPAATTVAEYLLPISGDKPPTPGLLAQTGTLDCTIPGRSNMRKDRLPDLDLDQPTVLCRNLFKCKIAYVATSCVSCHSVAVSVQGKAYSWGRNEFRQCGAYSEKNILAPREITEVKAFLIAAAVGKQHSVLLDDKGMVYGCGKNHLGQLGVGTFAEHIPTWRKGVVVGRKKQVKEEEEEGEAKKESVDIQTGPQIVQVSCGEFFTCALDSQGHLYTTGASEFGQLGTGETGEHFITANKIAFTNCSRYERRSIFVAPENENSYVSIGSNVKTMPLKDTRSIRISSVSCGKNHAVCVEAPSKNQTTPRRVFSWGCGNFGCLGHGIQSDEYYPRLLTSFRSPLFNSNTPISASCGSLCSLILTERGHVHYFGKHRSVGEATMKPMLVDALANNGHQVVTCSAGVGSIVCCTKLGATVSWGQGPYGELGYGAGSKSSAKPKFVAPIDKCIISQVKCGYGHTLFLIRDEDNEDHEVVEKLKRVEIEDLEEYDAMLASAIVSESDQKAGPGKRKGPGSAGKSSKKKK